MLRDDSLRNPDRKDAPTYHPGQQKPRSQNPAGVAQPSAASSARTWDERRERWSPDRD
jgi:hypothetical protein